MEGFKSFTDITFDEWRTVVDVKSQRRVPLHSGGAARHDRRGWDVS